MKKYMRIISTLLVVSFTFQYTAYPITTTEELQKQKQVMTGQLNPAQEQTQLDAVAKTALLNETLTISTVQPAPSDATISDELLPLPGSPAPTGGSIPTSSGILDPTTNLPYGTVNNYNMPEPMQLGELTAPVTDPKPVEVGLTITVEETVIKSDVGTSAPPIEDTVPVGDIDPKPLPMPIPPLLILGPGPILPLPSPSTAFDTDGVSGISDDEAREAVWKLKEIFEGIAEHETASDMKYDFDHDGAIDLDDVALGIAFLNSAGYKGIMTIANGDENKDGVISLQEFMRIYKAFCSNIGKTVPGGLPNPYDFNNDGNVDLADWSLFKKSASVFLPEQVAVLDVLDANRDGVISLEEAVKLVNDTARRGLLPGQYPFDPAYDFNRDGKIDNADSVIAFNVVKALGLEAQYYAFNQADTNQDLVISLNELNTVYQGFVAAMTTFDAKYDFNKDGKVDAADWDILKQAAKDAFPVAGDLNGDGKVTLDEIRRMNALFLGNQGSLDEMLAADRNGDGKVGIGEVIMAVNEFLKNASPEDTAMSTIDKNLDGQISLDELKSAYQGFVAALTTFDAKYDFNKDGKVDAADWGVLKGVLNTNAWGAAIVRAFETVDKDHDLRISVTEAVEGALIARKILAAVVGNIDLSLVAAYDFDQNDKVDTVDAMLVLQTLYISGHSEISKAVEVLDPNGDGIISLDELKTAYQGLLLAMTTYNANFDFNKDNKVDAADINILNQVIKPLKVIILPDGTWQEYDDKGRLVKQISNDKQKTTLEFSYGAYGRLQKITKTFGVPDTGKYATNKVVIEFFDIITVVIGQPVGKATETLNDGTVKIYDIKDPSSASSPLDVVLAKWSIQTSLTGSVRVVLVIGALKEILTKDGSKMVLDAKNRTATVTLNDSYKTTLFYTNVVLGNVFPAVIGGPAAILIGNVPTGYGGVLEMRAVTNPVSGVTTVYNAAGAILMRTGTNPNGTIYMNIGNTQYGLDASRRLIGTTYWQNGLRYLLNINWSSVPPSATLSSQTAVGAPLTVKSRWSNIIESAVNPGAGYAVITSYYKNVNDFLSGKLTQVWGKPI